MIRRNFHQFPHRKIHRYALWRLFSRRFPRISLIVAGLFTWESFKFRRQMSTELRCIRSHFPMADDLQGNKNKLWVNFVAIPTRPKCVNANLARPFCFLAVFLSAFSSFSDSDLMHRNLERALYQNFALLLHLNSRSAPSFNDFNSNRFSFM
jgi:hypothetical protein